ncbi:hypothetical protein P8C59_008979 [Phyllachora maydis]|uniref:Uncharacterized protein n=1 Tax=Phyllachora maydis TaxID=1825666 RepID=A0AAD9IC85_9PEZI|nr:hypothetical protein P8C59_008979 [Phyllachora maydis]
MAHHLQDVRTRKRATTIQRKKGKHLGPTSWLRSSGGNPTKYEQACMTSSSTPRYLRVIYLPMDRRAHVQSLQDDFTQAP